MAAVHGPFMVLSEFVELLDGFSVDVDITSLAGCGPDPPDSLRVK
jgi:hypothetical protein